jgi:valyl-tRNA synthetase
MSKSLGNFVSTPEVFGKYGSDASRQWASAGGSTGTDIPFRWEDVEYGWRFQRKLWNACRFASMRLEDYNTSDSHELELIDRWILTKLQKTIGECTEAMENCDFMNATEKARNFIWHVFCDHYLEAAKTRLYGEGKGKLSAQYTLYKAIESMLKLIAPIIPHLSEEIWRIMYNPEKSIHISEWPLQVDEFMDQEAEETGDLVIEVISDVRREKNRMGVSLNAPVDTLRLYAPEESLEKLSLGEQDIKDTLKVNTIVYASGDEGDSSIGEYPEISFTLILDEKS